MYNYNFETACDQKNRFPPVSEFTGDLLLNMLSFTYA